MEDSKPVLHSSKEGAVPTSIQRAATEYVKKTGVAEAEEAYEGLKD